MRNISQKESALWWVCFWICLNSSKTVSCFGQPSCSWISKLPQFQSFSVLDYPGKQEVPAIYKGKGNFLKLLKSELGQQHGGRPAAENRLSFSEYGPLNGSITQKHHVLFLGSNHEDLSQKVHRSWAKRVVILICFPCFFRRQEWLTYFFSNHRVEMCMYVRLFFKGECEWKEQSMAPGNLGKYVE